MKIWKRLNHENILRVFSSFIYVENIQTYNLEAGWQFISPFSCAYLHSPPTVTHAEWGNAQLRILNLAPHQHQTST